MGDVLVLAQDRKAGQAVLDRADVSRRRTIEVAEHIRRMTRIYQERLDGTRK